jgi:Uncharacterized membrane-associated protein
MEQWIIQIMNHYGYWAISCLIAIENIFPPIPSEVILTFGGYMTTYSSMNVWLVVLFATIGSVTGALVLYGVGRLLSAERLEKWLNGRIGHALHLKAEDVEKAKGWFDRKGKTTVFFCRFIPIVRSLISIPAGMAKMHMGIFLVLTTVGTAIWNVVLVYLGSLAGKSYQKIAGYMGVYSQIALVLLIIICTAAFFVFIKKRWIDKKMDD